MGLNYQDLTSKILEGCFEVSNELGAGFLESVYEKALIMALRQKGLKVESQVALEVRFRGAIVGKFYADILIENKILLELKTVSELTKKHFAQLLNYLKATEIEVGLIINFGKSKLEYRRFDNKFHQINPNNENSLINKLLDKNSDKF